MKKEIKLLIFWILFIGSFVIVGFLGKNGHIWPDINNNTNKKEGPNMIILPPMPPFQP